MINKINEKPTHKICGRALFNTIFTDNEDVKNKTILDIGCGFGWMEINLLNREASHVVGMEVSENDLKTAKKYVKNSRVKFEVGNALKLPFKDSTFDTVVSWEVLEHIPKNCENIMFSEVRKVLKKNGKFYLSTPYRSFFSNIFDPAWWLIRHRHYSKNQLKKFAMDNGFKIEKIVIKGGFWEIVSINNLYIAKWIFGRKPFLYNFFEKKQNEEYRKSKGFTNIFLKLIKK